MSGTHSNSWRDFHPFPLTKAQQELLDHYNTRRSLRQISDDTQNVEVIAEW